MGGFFGGGGGGGGEAQDMGPIYYPYEQMGPQYSQYAELPQLSYGQSLLSGDTSQGGRPAGPEGFSSAQESTTGMVPGAKQVLGQSPIWTWS